MHVSASKENILKKIRKALTGSTPLPFPASEGNSPVFQPSRQELEIEFGEQFSKLLGRFVYCADLTELGRQLEQLLANRKWEHVYWNEEALNTLLPAPLTAAGPCSSLAGADAAITTCEALVARTGSIVLSSAGSSGRTTSVYAPVHICVAFTDQLVYDVRDGLQLLKQRYEGKIPSFVTFATGPSRTADIEKTLVVGVHGPKEVFLFLVERNEP